MPVWLIQLADRIADWERSSVLFPLNQYAYDHAWFAQLAIFFGVYATYFIIAGVLVWALLKDDRVKAIKAVLVAILSFVLARLVLTEIIRRIVPRNRPFANWPVHQLILNEHGAGFPSGHTVALVAIAMAIYFYDKKMGAWLFVLAILVGMGRVISGVHFPTDILGGIIVGIISAWLIQKVVAPKLDRISRHTANVFDRLLPFTKR